MRPRHFVVRAATLTFRHVGRLCWAATLGPEISMMAGTVSWGRKQNTHTTGCSPSSSTTAAADDPYERRNSASPRHRSPPPPLFVTPRKVVSLPFAIRCNGSTPGSFGRHAANQHAPTNTLATRDSFASEKRPTLRVTGPIPRNRTNQRYQFVANSVPVRNPCLFSRAEPKKTPPAARRPAIIPPTQNRPRVLDSKHARRRKTFFFGRKQDRRKWRRKVSWWRAFSFAATWQRGAAVGGALGGAGAVGSGRSEGRWGGGGGGVFSIETAPETRSLGLVTRRSAQLCLQQHQHGTGRGAATATAAAAAAAAEATAVALLAPFLACLVSLTRRWARCTTRFAKRNGRS